MSEKVTWEVCPRCGDIAAVGWAPVAGIGSAPGTHRPVEFDCVAGCQVGVDELAEAYARPEPPGGPGHQA
jgi:hypothetical protein